MDKSEILRYMGAGPRAEGLDGLIHRAVEEVTGAARPQWVAREFPLEVQGSCSVVAGTPLESKSLADHLRGCGSVFLFALTLGPEVDRLLRRASLTDLAMMPVLQATAAALTEEWADRVQEELQQQAEQRGLFLRPRYSPGYGDLGLETQEFLFRALEVSKRTGITLTDSWMMVPSKSVSAFIGVSPDPSACHVGRCMICRRKDCPFRKEEDHGN